MSFCVEIGLSITDKQYYNDIHGKSTRNILEMMMNRKIEEELLKLSRQKEQVPVISSQPAPVEDQHDELNNLEGIDQFISDFAGIDRSLFSV